MRVYREAALTAAIVTRINPYEHLEFEDLTDSVRATLKRIEEAITEGRGALISALAGDPDVHKETVEAVARDILIPKLTGRLVRGSRDKNNMTD